MAPVVARAMTGAFPMTEERNSVSVQDSLAVDMHLPDKAGQTSRATCVQDMRTVQEVCPGWGSRPTLHETAPGLVANLSRTRWPSCCQRCPRGPRG